MASIAKKGALTGHDFVSSSMTRKPLRDVSDIAGQPIKLSGVLIAGVAKHTAQRAL